MDTTPDLGGRLPRLDSNQQPFGKHPQVAPGFTRLADQQSITRSGAPGGTQVHPFSDTNLTHDHGVNGAVTQSVTHAETNSPVTPDEAVPLAVALAPYAAKTDARRAGRAVNP